MTSMLASTDFTWHWHTGAAPWEEKVAELLPFISSVEARQEIWDVLFRQLTPYLLFFRSSVILEAVKVAPVPWSSTVEKLCETGQKLQHRNAVLIQEQASLVGVKTILRKYDIKTYATTGRESERMLQHLMKRGGEEGLADALAVRHVIGGKEELEVEQMYLEHLVVEKEDVREAISFLKKACVKSDEKGRELINHLVSMK